MIRQQMKLCTGSAAGFYIRLQSLLYHRRIDLRMSLKIGITLGDPAGIGPEITARALMNLGEHTGELVLIGNRDNFLIVSRETGLDPDLLDGMSFVDIPSSSFEMGRISDAAGSVAVRSIEAATSLAIKGELDGICTAPINKEAIRLAGSGFNDHTDMLKALTGSRTVSTVFETHRLRVIFLSKHVSLKDALDLITEESVYAEIENADYALRMLGIDRGKIAVSALNPHGGEGGMFGREELDILIPAISRAKPHYNVEGPYPADSVFHRAATGEFDMVVSLFHDQGHIAAKMYDFDRTVSMNIGLPFLRTSVDHGTAFDIAGKWIADGTSMLEAIRKSIAYSGSYRMRHSESARP